MVDKLAFQDAVQVDPRCAADSLQADFAELVHILNGELAKAGADAKARSHIAEARKAAERGLELSKQLAGMFRKGG